MIKLNLGRSICQSNGPDLIGFPAVVSITTGDPNAKQASHLLYHQSYFFMDPDFHQDIVCPGEVDNAIILDLLSVDTC